MVQSAHPTQVWSSTTLAPVAGLMAIAFTGQAVMHQASRH